MAYYQTGARYPLFWIILNAVPYTFPVIFGLLVFLALGKDKRRLLLQINRFSIPLTILACFIGLAFLALIIPY
jgi:hypothetical protein